MDLRPPVAAALLVALVAAETRALAETNGTVARPASATASNVPPPIGARSVPSASPPKLLPVVPPSDAISGEATPSKLPPSGTAIGVRPKLSAVRVSSPPILDGRLDDPVWALSPGTADFMQQLPYEGSPPSEPTRLRVIYDAEALYVGFECTQTKTAVTGRLTRRDEDSESDWVSVYIDSRRDARTAYFFAVNVKGVMADGIMHDGMAMAFEWDENWEGRASVTPNGWSAEIRVPLRILRFTPGLPVQDWGVWASRFVALLQEKDDWPYISREVAAPIPAFGRLDELRDLPRGGAIEVRPFARGQVSHRSADMATMARGYDGGTSGGIDLKLHLTQSLTLDVAGNPDFAEVEADTLILNPVNYEVQYPEKRPIFLEGADLFATPLNIFYSRRIGIPPTKPTLVRSADQLVDVPGAATIYAAAKLSGRVQDAWTVGLLSALASRNEYDVLRTGSATPVRQTVEPLTAFNVVRVRRELGDRAQIGAIGTATTRFEDSGNERDCPTGETAAAGVRCFRDATVGGLDAIWRSPAGTYVAQGQIVAGMVRQGLPQVQLDGTAIGSGDRGLGGWVKLAKEGGAHFLTELTYTGISRRLTYNDLGFMLRQNVQEAKAGFELRSLDPGNYTLERHLRLDLLARRTLDGLDLGNSAELGFTLRLQGFWNLHGVVEAAPKYFDDREIHDGSALERAAFWGGKAEVNSDPRRRVVGALKSEVRFVDAGITVDAQATLSVRPLPQLHVDLTPSLFYSSGEERYVQNSTSNVDPNPYIFGRLLLRNVGATVRIGYTFTPRLSLQTFAQLFLSAGHYTDFRQAPRTAGSRIGISDLAPLPGAGPLDADVEEAALNVNVVLRWEYLLGSTLFVVYTRSQVPTVTLASGEMASLNTSAIGRGLAADTVFVKLSFWWGS